jgi:hypothetical protein
MIVGLAGFGDSYGPDKPIEGTSLPSSELLSSSWGTFVAPFIAPAPTASARKRSYAHAPTSPSLLETPPSDYASTMFGPPSSLATNPSGGLQFSPPTTGGGSETLFGFIPLPSWLPKWAAYGLVAVGGVVSWHLIVNKGVLDPILRFGGGGKLVKNPKGRRRKRAFLVGGDDDRDLVERAAEFGEKFHWGIKGRQTRRAKVPKAPRVLTKLGELTEVTYKTKKRGESAEFFTHDFEEGKPTLAMDIENERLHIVGGDYTVEADGITG